MSLTVFHRPGVPQGHVGVPPESKQAGSVKSLENQKPMATEMLFLKAGSLTNCSAPANPPFQAPAIVADSDTRLRSELVVCGITTYKFCSSAEWNLERFITRRQCSQAQLASLLSGLDIPLCSPSQAIARFPRELKACWEINLGPEYCSRIEAYQEGIELAFVSAPTMLLSRRTWMVSMS
jgi:hypothetical protein